MDGYITKESVTALAQALLTAEAAAAVVEGHNIYSASHCVMDVDVLEQMARAVGCAIKVEPRSDGDGETHSFWLNGVEFFTIVREA